jgi:glucosamine-phosphate N-acetyltransferase
MSVLIYDSLLNVCKENKNNEDMIEDIKIQYLHLLSLLTSVTPISTIEFMNQVNRISRMGAIIVCYSKDVEDGKITIMGSGTIIYEPKIIRSCKNVGHIEDIVVHSNYRGQGISKNIIHKLIHMGSENNCYKVILDCKKDMVSFYEKNGFINNGSQMSKYF